MRHGSRSTSQSGILMESDQKDKTQKRFLHGADDEKRRAKLRGKLKEMQRGDDMTNKVMVEVGDLEKLKKAIAAFESGHTVFEDDETTLVELAKRVVAAEEKIQEALATPVDIDSY